MLYFILLKMNWMIAVSYNAKLVFLTKLFESAS